MSLNDIINEAQTTGGKFVKLAQVNDRLVGELVNIDKRPRKDPQGNVVFRRGTTDPRIEWIVTVRVDASLHEGADDDGLRKFNANENGQYAIKEAIKRAGVKNAEQLVGAKFALAMTEEAPSSMEQAKYTAQIKPAEPKPAAAAAMADLFD